MREIAIWIDHQKNRTPTKCIVFVGCRLVTLELLVRLTGNCVCCSYCVVRDVLRIRVCVWRARICFFFATTTTHPHLSSPCRVWPHHGGHILEACPVDYMARFSVRHAERGIFEDTFFHLYRCAGRVEGHNRSSAKCFFFFSNN